MDDSSSTASEVPEEVVVKQSRGRPRRQQGQNAIDMFTVSGIDNSLMSSVNGRSEERRRHPKRDANTPLFISDEEEGGAPLTAEDVGFHEWWDHIPGAQVEVQVPSFDPGSAYELYDGTVDHVLKESNRRDGLVYTVQLKSGHIERHSFDDLIDIAGGSAALQEFQSTHNRSRSQSSDTMVSLKLRGPKRKRQSFIDHIDLDLSSDDLASTRSHRPRRLSLTMPRRQLLNPQTSESEDPTESDTDDMVPRKRKRGSKKATRHGLRRNRTSVNYVDQLFDEDIDSDDETERRRPGRPYKRNPEYGAPRRSERANRAIGSMRERLEDDIPDANTRNSSRGAPKMIGVKESFVHLPRDDDFRNRHLNECDTCNIVGESKEKGPLIFCQGCTLAYHSTCLGVRKGRTHLVTKVGKDSFVLQCRRCIELASKNEPTAPRQGKCQLCHMTGAACAPFQIHKTPKQEQEEREINGGEDSVVPVSRSLINNPKNILFRCTQCFQAFHFHHLPPRKETLFEVDDDEQKAEKRWLEYCEDWLCHDCRNAKSQVGALIAWRPRNQDTYVYGTEAAEVVEDEKEYLVKWQDISYNHSEWMPGPWIWGVTRKPMRLAFLRRDEGKCLPKMRTEDAISEEYLRIDIVFQVEYNNIVQDRIEEVDLARITEVERARVKFKGLGYEDTVWERPPDPVQDPERWADFKTAYEDWVRGYYLKPAASSTMATHLRKVRSQKFEEQVMLKEQPKTLVGGKLMDYQLEGLNWLYYQWHRSHNAILADEMGLGKTIQVIGFMATLVEKFNNWPFLVVVPNSTCANWRREIKQWAPNLRVVTYFGSAKARELAEKYELFGNDGNKKELRCHVVVTSYDAAQDPSSLRILKRIYWSAMIVDEGQRLKSDKNILYAALSSLRTPFKLLLTGTPLQNNQRELFNLLQFLDSSINAGELEQKYAELTKSAVNELHEMLRPFFLRRTKAQVLKFLPTMAQVIVPVSMTPLQKQLYKSILGKNAELLRSIFGGERKVTSKGGLRNILMQLRKCLCHPFVYSIAIEERSSEAAVSHRRLVEASSKLQLLEIMLPKLQKRGHRVLIFSQFLDMLTLVEDFLQGLSMEHIRLDGTLGSLEKQKLIDKFNAPDSSIFAFLLSTRAGGVGINLATADTVIILDPDFNPHQDIQAISRAHRIGQKKKVLIFQMMTRGSAEEKIMQIGKKKMALDHVLIESMQDEDPDGNDLEDVLRFGAEALFNDDGSHDIHYDSTSVDKLLDRSQIEDTKTGKDDSAESQFSFARIWQNDTGQMAEGLGEGDGPRVENISVWEAILAERARVAAHEAKLKEDALGRGKRQRRNVDYQNQIKDNRREDDSDTDFQVNEDSHHEETASEEEEAARINQTQAADELKNASGEALPRGGILGNDKGSKLARNFARANVPPVPPPPKIPIPQMVITQCLACNNLHERGSCPLKRAGVETCNLCGNAHFGYQRSCPMLNSESAVREMLDAVKKSPEDAILRNRARAVLNGVKGNIVAKKRASAAKRAGVDRDGQPLVNVNGNSRPSGQGQGPQGQQPPPHKTAYGSHPNPPQGYPHHYGYQGNLGPPPQWPLGGAPAPMFPGTSGQLYGSPYGHPQVQHASPQGISWQENMQRMMREDAQNHAHKEGQGGSSSGAGLRGNPMNLD